MDRAASDPKTRFAPTELASEWDEPLGNVSYHVRALHSQGFLVAAGRRTVRGAVAHYYRASVSLLRD